MKLHYGINVNPEDLLVFTELFCDRSIERSDLSGVNKIGRY